MDADSGDDDKYASLIITYAILTTPFQCTAGT